MSRSHGASTPDLHVVPCTTGAFLARTKASSCEDTHGPAMALAAFVENLLLCQPVPVPRLMVNTWDEHNADT